MKTIKIILLLIISICLFTGCQNCNEPTQKIKSPYLDNFIGIYKMSGISFVITPNGDTLHEFTDTNVSFTLQITEAKNNSSDLTFKILDTYDDFENLNVTIYDDTTFIFDQRFDWGGEQYELLKAKDLL